MATQDSIISDSNFGVRLEQFLDSLSAVHRTGAATVGLAVLLVLPQFLNAYYVQVLFTVYLFVFLAFGWNALSGFTGYINFGYAGFIGIGAYTATILTVDLAFPWYAALLGAAVVTAVAGTLISIPMVRLDGNYFAVGMLALATAMRLAASSEYLSPITRGGTGIPFFAGLSIVQQYYLAAAVMAAAAYYTYRLAKSPRCLRLLAIREDELLASALGVQVTREKVRAMTIHAAIAGFGGGMLAFNLSYVDPTTVFNIRYTELPVVMVLFGSPGTVLGTAIGGVVVTLVSEWLWGAFPGWHQFFFGLAIMAIVLFMPHGVINRLKDAGYLPRRRTL